MNQHTSVKLKFSKLCNYYCINYLQLPIYVQNNIHIESQMILLAALAIEKKGEKLRLGIQLFVDLCKEHCFWKYGIFIYNSYIQLV